MTPANDPGKMGVESAREIVAHGVRNNFAENDARSRWFARAYKLMEGVGFRRTSSWDTVFNQAKGFLDGYAAGEKAMRERAAKEAEECATISSCYDGGVIDKQVDLECESTQKQVAQAIRSLPLYGEKEKGE